MIRFECDAEEVVVRVDVLPNVVGLRSTETIHLTIHQIYVEIGEFNVVAVRVFVASEETNIELPTHSIYDSTQIGQTTRETSINDRLEALHLSDILD